MNSLLHVRPTYLVLTVLWTLLAASSLSIAQEAAEDSEDDSANEPAMVSGGYLLAQARSARPPEEEDAPIPDELRDPAFEQYVEPLVLGHAWRELDCGLLTDSALQLLHGERILLRSHRAVSGKEVALIAARLAAERRDAECLNRLETAAKTSGDEQLIGAIETVKTLGSASRDTASSLRLPVDETSAEEFNAARRHWKTILRYQLTGDSRYISHLRPEDEKAGDRFSGLGKDARKDLERMMGESRADGSDRKPVDEQTLLALNKLALASRPVEDYLPSATIGENYGYDVTIRPDYQSVETGGVDSSGIPETSPAIGFAIDW